MTPSHPINPAVPTTNHAERPRAYGVIYCALMFLLVFTVAASYFDFGAFLNLTIALSIATIKAVLVILFFMHVRHSSKLVWVFAGAAFLWLGILLVLTFSDYLSRASALGASGGSMSLPK